MIDKKTKAKAQKNERKVKQIEAPKKKKIVADVAKKKEES